MSSTWNIRNSKNFQKVINHFSAKHLPPSQYTIYFKLFYSISHSLLLHTRVLSPLSTPYHFQKKKIIVFYKWIPRLTKNFSPGADSLLKFFREITVRNPLVHLLLFLCSTIKGTRGEKKRKKEKERKRVPPPSIQHRHAPFPVFLFRPVQATGHFYD